MYKYSSDSTAKSKYDDFKLLEDDKTLIVKYIHAEDMFDIIYDKTKDKVMLLKNGKPAVELRPDETERYKEFLDVVICYHHDRNGEHLH